MSQKLLQVNFGLNVAPAEYTQICVAVAESFAKVAGLRWKLWFIDERKREAGAFTSSRISAPRRVRVERSRETGRDHPALKNVTMRASDIMPDVTAVTRGPVGTTVNA